jgi:hypothetical protein
MHENNTRENDSEKSMVFSRIFIPSTADPDYFKHMFTVFNHILILKIDLSTKQSVQVK